jgi:hypothetical protein
MRTGSRDSQIPHGAGMIHRALGERAPAARRLRLSLASPSTRDLLQPDAARAALGHDGS